MRQALVTCGLAAALAIGTAVPAAGQQLHLLDLSKLSADAIDVVDVSVDQALLGIAASFMSDEADEAEIKSLLSSITGIYVRSFTYAKDGAYDPAILDSVRKQLSAGQWTRLVAARSSAEHSDTAVYLWRDGDKPGGLAVLSAGPREVTLVNIVGVIDLAKLRSLQGKFGVPDLDLETTPRGKPRP